MSHGFDANRRLAEVALWLDAAGTWIGQATDEARVGQDGEVTLTLERDELALFVSGLQATARTLLGLVQPVPPPLPKAPKDRRRLRLVR